MRKTLSIITSNINSKKTNSSSSASPSGRIRSEENQEQSVRDIKLSIEYKSLKENAPGGVYIVPSLNNTRLFYGVIFVRRGAYANGVFKFKVKLPSLYNGINTWPQITFTSKVYSPLIHYETGSLNIKEAFPRWDPQRHYLVTLLTYLKKIFYMKTFEDYKKALLNTEAYDTACTNPELFKLNIKACVSEAQNMVHISSDADSTIQYPSLKGVKDNDDDCDNDDVDLLSEHVQYNIFWEMLKEEYFNDPSKITKTRITELIQDVAP